MSLRRRGEGAAGARARRVGRSGRLPSADAHRHAPGGADHRDRGAAGEPVGAHLRVRAVCAAERASGCDRSAPMRCSAASSKRTWRRSLTTYRSTQNPQNTQSNVVQARDSLRTPRPLRSIVVITRLPRIHFLVPGSRAGCRRCRSTRRCSCPAAAARLVGYTEASRGCRHLCRHCPVVPIYNGQFRVVQPDVVLADVDARSRRAPSTSRSAIPTSSTARPTRCGSSSRAAREAPGGQLRRDDQGRAPAAAPRPGAAARRDRVRVRHERRRIGRRPRARAARQGAHARGLRRAPSRSAARAA